MTDTRPLPRSLPELFARTPEPPLEHMALVLAYDAYPSLLAERHLDDLDRLAAPLRDAAAGANGPRAQAAALARHFGEALGFRGDAEQYDDPRNSYLNEVLARRRGLPITLAVVLVALGTRAGLTVEGVGFPGHFLARVGGAAGVLVDPFDGGAVVEGEALATLAERALGHATRLGPEHTAPVGARAVAVRMLANLRASYGARGDHARALVVSDRLVDLAGATPERRRDRGLHALAAGALGVAAADLEAYAAARPTAPDAARVRAALAQVRARSGTPLQ